MENLDLELARELVRAIEWRFESNLAPKVKTGRWKLVADSISWKPSKKLLGFRAVDPAWLSDQDHYARYRVWRLSDKASFTVDFGKEVPDGPVLELPARCVLEAAKQILANGMVAYYDPEEGSGRVASQFVVADLPNHETAVESLGRCRPDDVYGFEQILLSFSVCGEADPRQEKFFPAYGFSAGRV